MPKKKTKKFAPSFSDMQEEIKKEEPEEESEFGSLKPIVDGSDETPTADPRLDKIMPLIVKMIIRLLSVAGLARFRLDFIKEIEEIMEGKDGKTKR